MVIPMFLSEVTFLKGLSLGLRSKVYLFRGTLKNMTCGLRSLDFQATLGLGSFLEGGHFSRSTHGNRFEERLLRRLLWSREARDQRVYF